MHGKTSTASQASAGRDTRHAGPVRRAGHPVGPLPPADAQGNTFGDRWPLHSFLELGALPGAVPCARLHAQQMLWEWHLTALSDTTGLLISELVTNAVSISRADARATPVRVWVLSDGICVLIVVWDASLLSPVRVNSGDEDESGRGLLLVETLSTRWNWYFPPQPEGGKAVWALIKELPSANAVFRSAAMQITPAREKHPHQGRIRECRLRFLRHPRSQPCPGVAARADGGGAASRSRAAPPLIFSPRELAWEALASVTGCWCRPGRGR
jgi:hypothetical protein